MVETARGYECGLAGQSLVDQWIDLNPNTGVTPPETAILQAAGLVGPNLGVSDGEIDAHLGPFREIDFDLGNGKLHPNTVEATIAEEEKTRAVSRAMHEIASLRSTDCAQNALESPDDILRQRWQDMGEVWSNVSRFAKRLGDTAPPASPFRAFAPHESTF